MRAFRPGTGTGQWAEKSFDCFCFHPWPSEGYQRHVLEAKISRSDFLKEAKDPLKKRAGLYCGTKFWFVAPKGVVRNLEEIPTNCGYYEVGVDSQNNYSCIIRVPAPELADEPPTWNFLAAATRRVIGDEGAKEFRGEIDHLKKRLAQNRKAREELKVVVDEQAKKIEKLERHIESLQKVIKL